MLLCVRSISVVISLYLTCRLKKTTHFSVGVVSVLP
ncbi:Uncharacterised protein [Vibrio cholerae]|nr:Uncharacterised protein [Vibrio cholerae]